MRIGTLLCLIGCVASMNLNLVNLSIDYFLAKGVKFVCYLSCESGYDNRIVVSKLMQNGLRISLKNLEKVIIEPFLRQWHVPVGVIIDARCENTNNLLDKASSLMFFDSAHMWLVLMDGIEDYQAATDELFESLHLSVDADVVVVHNASNDMNSSLSAPFQDEQWLLTDVFNYGKVQGNPLETQNLGTWNRKMGLVMDTKFKYYRRWDFHNLTLRAVSVIVDRSRAFKPEVLLDMGYTPGIAAMTKLAAQLLQVLREQHNFRFNYTIAGRWIGAPERNSTLAVTNSLFWREQDISCTCARIYPKWMQWVDIFFPPATKLETKFYYLIPDKGVGGYENRFLTPMSPGVWWSAAGALAACGLVLAVAAAAERHPGPRSYALFSVLAALCQQAYEDGVQLFDENLSSQGRRATMLVVGMTSMLLYNYYTSSVVSWLLNAAVPSIDSIDGLAASDLELVFENIGYAKQWLDNPGFYYFAGYKNPKEDALRDKKVTGVQKTTPLLQPAEAGIELIRRGAYAYHTEPYTASQVIARKFEERELCALGSLQMMPPSQVYIMGQKRSPYGRFFIWSMMRLSERGHTQAARRRVGGRMPACSGRTPRALALGQAAPAFALLAQLAVLATVALVAELLWHRWRGYH